MDLEPLPSIVVAMAEQRSLDAVLKTIIEVVARQPGVALARLWLREPHESCPVCADRERDEDPGLHLRSSAGQPVSAGSDWSRIDGSFHRIPLSSSRLKIAHIALTGASIRIPRLTEDQQQNYQIVTQTKRSRKEEGRASAVVQVRSSLPAAAVMFTFLRP